MIILIRTKKTIKVLGDGFMSKNDLVMELIEKNNGVITSFEAKAKGINNKTLQRMEKLGQIERVEHGLYMDPNQMKMNIF